MIIELISSLEEPFQESAIRILREYVQTVFALQKYCENREHVKK